MKPLADCKGSKSHNIVTAPLPSSISKLRRLLVISLFSSLSFLIMSCFELPLIPAYPMFKYDASEVPALLVGFALGTSSGIYVVVLKHIMYFLLSGKGFADLGLGTFMGLVAGLAMVFVATRIYFMKPTRKGAITGLLAGTITMTVVMLPLNYFILSLLPLLLPAFGDLISPDKALFYIFTGALPFNLIKGFLTSFFTFVLYKKVSPFLKDKML